MSGGATIAAALLADSEGFGRGRSLATMQVAGATYLDRRPRYIVQQGPDMDGRVTMRRPAGYLTPSGPYSVIAVYPDGSFYDSRFPDWYKPEGRAGEDWAQAERLRLATHDSQ